MSNANPTPKSKPVEFDPFKPVSNAQLIAELRIATIALRLGLPMRPVNGGNDA